MPVPKMKILWASVFSLLDTSSGAAIAIREMLMQLVHRGHEVDILGPPFSITRRASRASPIPGTRCAHGRGSG
jgi:hypothetical protein